MSLPFFGLDASARRPVPCRLWSVRFGSPLLACAVSPFQCLWVHYDGRDRRTYLHDKERCRLCAEGNRPQKRGYAPAFVQSALRWNGVGKPPEPSEWTKGVLELPDESLAGVECVWPMVWWLERLDRTNGRIRSTLVKSTKAPLPALTEIWDIEPTIRRVYGLHLVAGGVQ